MGLTGRTATTRPRRSVVHRQGMRWGISHRGMGPWSPPIREIKLLPALLFAPDRRIMDESHAAKRAGIINCRSRCRASSSISTTQRISHGSQIRSTSQPFSDASACGVIVVAKLARHSAVGRWGRWGRWGHMAENTKALVRKVRHLQNCTRSWGFRSA